MLYALLAVSILLIVSLAWNCLQYLANKKLQEVSAALWPAAKATDEFLVFMLNASNSPRPGVEIRCNGQEMSDMFVTRMNDMGHALQDASGIPRMNICDKGTYDPQHRQEDPDA